MPARVTVGKRTATEGTADVQVRRGREQSSLAVAEGNLCSYCLSAHTFFCGKAGLSEKDIAALLAAAVKREGNEGLRTVALLQVLYAAGLRVSELSSLPVFGPARKRTYNA